MLSGRIMHLIINSSLVIPSKELQWRFSRSSGHGGQGVNKTNSRVELVFDIESSAALGSFRKQRLLRRLEKDCTNGCITIVSSEERSQYKNRQLALARLKKLLVTSLKSPPKPRKAAKPNYAAQKRRVNDKKHRGKLKKSRQSLVSDKD